MISTALIPKCVQSTTKHLRVVLASTDFQALEGLISLLRQKQLEPILSASLNEAESLLARKDTALVICHASSSDGAFRDLLKVTARIGSRAPVIICTDAYDPRLYLEAMDLGAFDYFAYPYYRDGVEWVVGNALREARRICCGPESATYESVPS